MIVPITSDDYPPQLQQIAKPPPLLYIRGNPHCLHLPQLAIVGSRRMTRGAEIIAHSWAKNLAASGFTITSGMAISIDSCAHRFIMQAAVVINVAHALEQNREVFAIPGSINSPQSKGCHQLIKQGACLVETTAELVEEIAGPLATYGEKYQHLMEKPAETMPAEKLSHEESLLLELLGYEPILIDELETPWPMDKLLQLLIALELKGVIVSEQGYFSRVR